MIFSKIEIKKNHSNQYEFEFLLKNEEYKESTIEMIFINNEIMITIDNLKKEIIDNLREKNKKHDDSSNQIIDEELLLKDVFSIKKEVNWRMDYIDNKQINQIDDDFQPILKNYFVQLKRFTQINEELGNNKY